MDLIDRQELLDNLNRFAPEHYSALVNNLIMKQKTVDPVKHRHWIERTMLNNFTGKWQRVFMCSKCRHTQLNISAFCGGCGARMEGAEHD